MTSYVGPDAAAIRDMERRLGIRGSDGDPVFPPPEPCRGDDCPYEHADLVRWGSQEVVRTVCTGRR